MKKTIFNKKLIILFILFTTFICFTAYLFLRDLTSSRASFLKFEDEVNLDKLNIPDNTEFYFSHYGLSDDENKLFKANITDNRLTIGLIADEKTKNDYIRIINDTKDDKLFLVRYRTDDIFNDFAKSITNSSDGSISVELSRFNFGNLKYSEKNKKSRFLLDEGFYSISPLWTRGYISYVQYLNDDLLLLQTTKKVDIVKEALQCKGILLSCQVDNVYYSSTNIDKSQYDNYFLQFYPDCQNVYTGITESENNGCVVYDLFPSIVLYDLKTGKWAELLVGEGIVTKI